MEVGERDWEREGRVKLVPLNGMVVFVSISTIVITNAVDCSKGLTIYSGLLIHYPPPT